MKRSFILFISFFRVIPHSYLLFIENEIINLVNEEKLPALMKLGFPPEADPAAAEMTGFQAVFISTG